MKVKENEKIFNFSVPKFKELFILWRVQVNVSTHRQKINLVNNKWFEPDGTKNGTFYATCCEKLGYFMSVRRLLLQACVVIFKGVTPHFSLNIYDYNDSFCMLKAKHILFLAKKNWHNRVHWYHFCLPASALRYAQDVLVTGFGQRVEGSIDTHWLKHFPNVHEFYLL